MEGLAPQGRSIANQWCCRLDVEAAIMRMEKMKERCAAPGSSIGAAVAEQQHRCSSRGAKQEGIVELAKNTLRLPVQVGTISHDVAGMVDNLADPLYAASIGLMLYGLEAGNSTAPAKRTNPLKIGPALDKAKNIFSHIFTGK